MGKIITKGLTGLSMLIFSSTLWAAETPNIGVSVDVDNVIISNAEARQPAIPEEALAEQLESLKKEVIGLNRDLFILEEELLYPEDTQITVFVSMDTGNLFQLDSVKLTLNGEVITHYLYTDRQIDALYRGGIQRLLTTNLKQGDHELVAVFIGKGPNDRDYKRAHTLNFDKQDDAHFIELRIVDDSATAQPTFDIKQW
ncbi:Uncharacterised protein [BD1-7 clade bacterium]|uniref:AraC family transcriptional regulator n=1 Tax=BD1-7 clade bacterium TaxID=2029982 RepID=A0A5S9P6X2_9GAMM|nr:Uncharacterised protein [BD1-7 clade bacterium]CAA0099214.1 Uncharacterised protein [BD1-7 clade bacterium]